MTKATVEAEVSVEWLLELTGLAAWLSLRKSDTGPRDFVKEEKEVQERLHKIGRLAMVELMQSADTHTAEVEISGALLGRWRRTMGHYTTIFGDVDFERSTYRKPKNGQVFIPLDLRLGIVEGRYTPRVARLMTAALARMPETEAAEMLAETGVAMVSSSTIHRIPLKIAARLEKQCSDVDEALRERLVIPEGAVGVQVSLDGVMVPQDGEQAAPRGRHPTDNAHDPPRHEVTYGAVNVGGPVAGAANDEANNIEPAGRVWHEATVGALHFFNELGRPLSTVRFARMPEFKQVTLLRQLHAGLRSVIEQQPKLDVVLASDGAKKHWVALDIIAAELKPKLEGRLFFALDFYHASSYLTKGADLVFGAESADGKVQAATWREVLIAHENGATRVIDSMRHFCRQLPTDSAAREKLEKVISFLQSHNTAGRMNYSALQAEFLPIGTGVIEATAKTVVGVRMKRAGARFSQHGGQTILLFRAALVSSPSRFDDLMEIAEESYRKLVREVRPLAA